MVRSRVPADSLRISRPETERLVVALLISLLVHVAAWGGYEGGKKMGLWNHLPRFSWWQKKNQVAPKTLSPTAVQRPTTEPTTFVDVVFDDPVPPKQAKYYSSKNSRAANPDTANLEQPKINGKQQDVPKTEDVAKPMPLQPTPPAAQSQAQPQPQVTRSGQTATPDEPEQPAGDLSPRKKKSGATPATEQPARPAQPERPRTLKQVQQPASALAGRQMQQAGGVKRPALVSSLDAKATPFGEYDSAIVRAIQEHWYSLLESQQFAQDRTGRVTLQFKLMSDGRIIEMKTTDNTVGPLLGYVCQEAIEQSAPFAKWPPDMLRMIGANYREITFTFYYY